MTDTFLITHFLKIFSYLWINVYEIFFSCAFTNFITSRSLSPLLNNPRMDRHIKSLVRETLPEFTNRDKGMIILLKF